MGFSGKLVVHPSQLAPVNEVFTPSPGELASARHLVRLAAEHGEGALRVDGRMVDRPVLAKARRVVRLSEAIEARKRGS